MMSPSKRGPAYDLDKLLRPIMIFAAVAAPLCWAGAWFFRERGDFSDALIGLGALPIVVAVCAYLYLLVNKIERG
ncbi:MAG: hypothetical protein A4S14_17750 [Proteobacteria bacterium SG_bin9]|nr:MAG: hypothetical protein A4S14_17750 [Proteobacteria bacterium SG_bin9]